MSPSKSRPWQHHMPLCQDANHDVEKAETIQEVATAEAEI